MMMMVVLILRFMLIVDVGVALVITLVLRLILVAVPKEIFCHVMRDCIITLLKGWLRDDRRGWVTSGRLQHLGEMLCVASLLLNDMCDLKMGPIMQDDMITFTIQDFKIMVTISYDVNC